MRPNAKFGDALLNLVAVAEKFAKSADGTASRERVLTQLLAAHIALQSSARRTEGARLMFALAGVSLVGMFTAGAQGSDWSYAIGASALAGALGMTGAVLASDEKVTMRGARDLLAVAESQLGAESRSRRDLQQRVVGQEHLAKARVDDDLEEVQVASEHSSASKAETIDGAG